MVYLSDAPAWRVGEALAATTHAPRSPMSSISFPNGGHSGLPSSSSEHDDHFYPPAFESASVSGFQMNPMSSHPPRTPRVSIISGTGTYGGSIYTPKEEAPRDEPPEDDAEVDREDEAVKKRAQRIRKEEIWKEMLKTSQGRDKAFVSDRSIIGMSKTLSQYVVRLLGDRRSCSIL